jgi:hypothetical protein
VGVRRPGRISDVDRLAHPPEPVEAASSTSQRSVRAGMKYKKCCGVNAPASRNLSCRAGGPAFGRPLIGKAFAVTKDLGLHEASRIYVDTSVFGDARPDSRVVQCLMNVSDPTAASGCFGRHHGNGAAPKPVRELFSDSWNNDNLPVTEEALELLQAYESTASSRRLSERHAAHRHRRWPRSTCW